MARRRLDTREGIGLGEIEVYHPVCRTRILITNVTLGAAHLSFEGICYACDKYVHLTTELTTLTRELRSEERGDDATTA